MEIIMNHTLELMLKRKNVGKQRREKPEFKSTVGGVRYFKYV